MLTVYDYGRIRRAHRDGMSIRKIARTFPHSQRYTFTRSALRFPTVVYTFDTLPHRQVLHRVEQIEQRSRTEDFKIFGDRFFFL